MDVVEDEENIRAIPHQIAPQLVFNFLKPYTLWASGGTNCRDV
jgi:hypothetical protein